MSITPGPLVEDDASLLTDEEAQTIVLAAVTYGGKEGVPEPVIDRVYQWAQDVRFDSMLLDLILEGKLLPTWDEEALEGVEVLVPVRQLLTAACEVESHDE